MSKLDTVFYLDILCEEVSQATMPIILNPKENEIFDRIVDLLAEEKCELMQAERILACVVLRIRGSSLVQDSSHKHGLSPVRIKDVPEKNNPFAALPFRLDIGVD